MDISVAKKLLIIFLFPVIVFFFYMYEHTFEMVELHEEAKKVERVITFTIELSTLMHAIQEERGLATGFLWSKGEKFGELLLKQRTETDEKMVQFLQKAGTLEEGCSDKYEQFSNAFIQLDTIKEIRKKIDLHSIDKDEALMLYTKINSAFLDVIVRSLKSLRNAEFIKDLNSYINFLYYKEQLGLERANGIAYFISGNSDKDAALQFFMAMAKQKSYKESFYMLAGKHVTDFYEKTLQNSVFDEVEEIEKRVLQMYGGDKFDMSVEQWLQIVTKKMDMIKEAEDYQSKMMLQKSAEVNSRTFKNMRWIWIINLTAIIFAIVLGYIVVRRQQALNSYLAKRINESVIAINEQNTQMMEQARLASMGEMMNNIAHQWRQPLTALGLVLQNIELAYESGALDSKGMSGYVQKSMRLIKSMSKTIDDFRNFFKPDKKETEFSLKKSVDDSIMMIEAILTKHDIKIVVDIDKKALVLGYPNEFSQVLLNIISNAKDALLENRVETPEIKIVSYHKKGDYILSISDNGGGINDAELSKVFEPYFTTKEEGKGTGIGLHMSKMIIEEHMHGSIEVKNIEDSNTKRKGAQFIIKIPKVQR